MSVDALRNGYRNGPDDRGGSERSCPVCGTTVMSRRATYCSLACRLRAFRRRHQAPSPVAPRLARQSVVYACPECERRLVDQRRCPDCHLFMRRVGPGGSCPHCDEPVALSELLDG